MSALSILHRACLRLALLPVAPLRAPLRSPRLPRPLRLPRRAAMSSVASRMSHIAAAAASGESNEPAAAAASGLGQEDDGRCCFLLLLGHFVDWIVTSCRLVDWAGLAGERLEALLLDRFLENTLVLVVFSYDLDTGLLLMGW